MSRVWRCAHCATVIGFYEPLVVMEDDGPCHTSVAAEPKRCDDAQGEHYHRDCYAAASSQRRDV
jgi:hypothetical protein